MVRAVEGIYRAGRVELLEQPTDVDSARVVVLFLPDSNGAGHLPNAGAADAIERVLARMKSRYDLGGPPYPQRGALYDRFGNDDE